MVSKTLLITTGALVLSVHLWHSRQHAVFQRQLEAMADVNGFVPVLAPVGVRSDTVVILAPLNCPRAGAQRANALAKYLTEHDIPNVRSAEYSVTGAGANAMQMQATDAIATGTLPVVLLNGRGEDNPAPWQVAAEYRGTQR
ncbi:MAG TPA: hypothetical protein VGT07_16080 [Steroidobacteraceae bacterium]|nr:hypothetical protein [Steroidobacteraceae bacterium]